MSGVGDVLASIKKVLLIEETVQRMEGSIDSLATDVRDLRRDLSGLGQRLADMEGYLRAATRTPFGDKPRIEG